MKSFSEIILVLTLFMCEAAESKVIQANGRFLMISAESKNVKVEMDHPWRDDHTKERLTLCSITATLGDEEFFFVTRRAVLFDHCWNIVTKARRMLRKHKEVEILGNSFGRRAPKKYSALFEMIRTKDEHVGYFDYDFSGDIAKVFPEWNDYKDRPIDPKYYP